MAGPDRAINFPLRVQGIGDVERDFKRAGDAGEKSFSRVAKSANGAAQEVSEYHARLKRVAADARAQTANLPELNKGPALDSARARNRFVLDRVDAEKNRIRSGLPDVSLPGAAEGARGAGLLSAAFRGVGGAAGIAALGVTVLGGIVYATAEAFNEHERMLAKFNATLSFSGNLSSATRAQIEDMAAGVADATLQTEEAALSAAAALATVPGITAAALDEALTASARFADAMGKDVNDTAKQTAEVLTALAKNDLKALVNALDGVSEPAQKMILDLAQAGKTAEAQAVYLKELSDAAGNGPNSLAVATDRASESFKHLKTDIGALSAGPVEAVMNAIAFSLNTVRSMAGDTAKALLYVVSLGNLNTFKSGPSQPTAMASQALDLFGAASGRSPLGLATLALGSSRRWSVADSKALAEQKDDILHPDKPKKPRKGRKPGKSDEEREAEAARKAADRVREANDDVVASYRLRAEEAAARLGLEGAALEAVERRQEIDATVRRLSTDLIDKEVAARKAEAVFAKTAFNETTARAEATAVLAAQTAALREHATALYDDEAAQKDQLDQLERAKDLYEATRTPIELIKREVASLVDLLRNEAITPDIFNRRMNQLAEDMVDGAKRAKDAWRGLGDEISGTLKDVIFNGGSAMDVLRELVGIAASRMFDKNIGDPLSDWIDGLTGNNREKNIASARAGLPMSADVTAGSVSNLGINADMAATALGRLSAIPDFGAPVAALGSDADAAGAALRAAGMDATQFGGSLAQVIASLAGGGGGGGASGLLGLALNLGLAAATGGSGVGITNGGTAVKALGKTPGFAGGGLPPIGMPFEVGENGKERMILFPGGGGRVISGDQTRRMANDNNAAPAVNNYITVPPGADPRRTTTTISRAVQGGIQRASSKGLARGPRSVR